MPSSYNIGSRYENFVRDLVESGRYSSQRRAMRDGLRLLEEREEQRGAKLDALRGAIRKGVESGPGIQAEEVFARLEAKYRGWTPVVLAPAAADDLEEIGDYIRADNPPAAGRFIAARANDVRDWTMRPGEVVRVQKSGPGLRSVPFGNYVIFYTSSGDLVVSNGFCTARATLKRRLRRAANLSGRYLSA